MATLFHSSFEIDEIPIQKPNVFQRPTVKIFIVVRIIPKKKKNGHKNHLFHFKFTGKEQHIAHTGYRRLCDVRNILIAQFFVRPSRRHSVSSNNQLKQYPVPCCICFRCSYQVLIYVWYVIVILVYHKIVKKGTYNDTEYEYSARLFGSQLMLNRSKDSTQRVNQHSECSFAKRNMFKVAINYENINRVT